MRGRTSRLSRASGLTLIEVLCASVLATGVIGVSVVVGGSSTRVMRDCALQNDLDQRALSTLDRVVRELSTTSVGSLGAFPAWPLWDSELNFGRIASVDQTDGDATWTPCRIQFLPDDGETLDGTDENQNGLVDECAVVAVVDRGLLTERSVVLTRFVRAMAAGETANGADDNGNGLVDEAGLSFERRGRTLTIRLCLERLDADGRPVTRTAQTTVTLRN